MRRKAHPALNRTSVRKHQERLVNLSNAVHGAMIEHGLLADGDNCHVVCEDEIVIGPNGEPTHQTVCRTICE
jgi:hypothetical protein